MGLEARGVAVYYLQIELEGGALRFRQRERTIAGDVALQQSPAHLMESHVGSANVEQRRQVGDAPVPEVEFVAV